MTSILLRTEIDRRRAVQAVIDAQDGWSVRISPPKRTVEQNAKFHAICQDMGRANAEWMGKPRKMDEWKVLLVSGHSIVTKQGAEVVPGLEGEFVNLRESTSSMTVSRLSSLIEYTLAYCHTNNIPVREDPPEAA